MPRKLPTEQELVDFIVATHNCDHITLTHQDVTNTIKNTGVPSPYVQGHRKALKYAVIDLCGSTDFPIRDISMLSQDNVLTHLHWLTELHSMIMYPVAQANLFSYAENNISTSQCGTLRSTSKALAFNMAPEPNIIPTLLFLWLKELATINNEVKDNIDNPYGLTQYQAKRMGNFAKETPMFISCLQPFDNGNNLVARIVENIIRINWYMPWKIINPGHQLDEFNKNLNIYQQTTFKEWLSKTK